MKEKETDWGDLVAQAVAWGIFLLFWIALLAYFVIVLRAV